MTSLNINVRVDANDKKSFEQFCTGIGMDVSTVINMFIKEVLREQKLTFKVRTNDFAAIISKELKEAELEMDNTSKIYSKDEVLESMNNIIG